MAAARLEPFQVALTSLRDRLRAGTLPPGARITAVDVADELRLSATPVREALSRLAGEGLIEDRRGQGFFVRLLTPGDIADLYRVSLSYLLIAHDPQRFAAVPGGALSPSPRDEGEPAATVEGLFLAWAAETRSRTLVQGLRTALAQLAVVRRREHLVLDDLTEEAARLQAWAAPAERRERLVLIRPYHARRIRAAGRLAGLQEGGENSTGIV